MQMLEDYFLSDDRGNILLSLGVCDLHYPYSYNGSALHRHEDLEISYVKEGAAEYYVDGRTYDIRPGDVFLFNNKEEHGIALKFGEHLVNAVVHFEPELIWNKLSAGIDYGFLRAFFERSRNFSNRLDRSNLATKKIYNLLCQIEEEFLEKRPAYDLMIKVILQNIFVEIIREFDYVSESKEENTLVLRDAKSMNHVLRYIKAHFCDQVKLEELAAEAAMSPSYFSTSFKAYNGISPFEYITSLRIKKSIEYISSTDKSMTEIAMLCGFNNSTSFIKNFKKITGLTPTAYRLGKEK